MNNLQKVKQILELYANGDWRGCVEYEEPVMPLTSPLRMGVNVTNVCLSVRRHTDSGHLARKALQILNDHIQTDNWQDIETAPDNGSEYLGIIKQPSSCFGSPFICHYDDDKHTCVHQTELKPHYPTHWHPLPKSPKGD